MKLHATERGFLRAEFKDANGEKCSIQESSAFGSLLWLGVDDPKPKILTNGWRNIDLPTGVFLSGRMHLTQEMVKELLPYLEHFANTGSLKKG